MRILAIALGNTLRRDDGVAQAVLPLLHMDSRALMQLTPEVASDIADYEAAVFIDADPTVSSLTVEPVDRTSSPPALTHISTPAEVVALSRELFGFAGHALVCRIPVSDFSTGEGLSPQARALAAEAAARLNLLFGDKEKSCERLCWD